MIVHPCDANVATLDRHAPDDLPEAWPRAASADGDDGAVYDWLTAGRCCDGIEAAPRRH